MKKIITTLVTGLFLFAVSSSVYAQTPAPASTTGSTTSENVGTLSINRLNDSGVESLGRLISATFNVALLVAGIFVFAMLILGGYGWITAGGDKSKVEEARTRITNALIGIAIVASAWALVAVVGQFFGFRIDSLAIPSATGPNTVGTGTGTLGL